MRRVFISYRRGLSTPYARQIYDELSERLGEDRVFFDIDKIEAGTDFVEVIERHIDESGLMLAILDPTWSKAAHDDGKLRLHDDEDPVRLEISRALERKLTVVPVLVGGAKIPKAGELPENLKPLVRRHAHELSDTRWRSDMDSLVKKAAGAIGMDAPKPRAQTKWGGIGRRAIAIGAAVLALVGGVAYATLGSGGGGADSGSNAALELSSDTVSLASSVRSDADELAGTVIQGADTAAMASGFEESQATATELGDRIASDLADGDPGRDDLDTSARSLAEASAQLAEVATDPAAPAATAAATTARDSMDQAWTGIEDALADLRLAFADEGDSESEESVANSAETIPANKQNTTAVFDSLVSAVGP